MIAWQSPHGRPLPEPGRRTLVMGVLNVTPDSFSDGGQLPSPQAVVDRAGVMLESGADVLDLGGESTRPGSTPVSASEELDRVLPALAALRRAFPEAPISVDTYKAEVGEASICAGADILNDVWGFTYALTSQERHCWREAARLRQTSPSLPLTPMAKTAGRLKCPVILMHNRPDRAYVDFWADVILDLEVSLSLAETAGLPRPQVWLDPGFGFAKDVPQNLEVLKRLDRIVALGYPVLVGTSRKSTIGKVLGTTVEHRLEGTAATLVWSIQQGCAMVRVHDVAPMIPFVRMADAIKAGAAFPL